MKFLIFGLGNIGPEYTKTKHNIGFEILDAYAEASNIHFTSKRYADYAETKFKGRKIILLKPSTYVNLSGKSVRYYLQKEKTDINKILIITDDINLPFGKIRIRKKGGDGGHNGLKSIIEYIGTNKFARLRYGIGNDFGFGKQADFVLSKLTKQEIDIFEKNKKKCIEAIKYFTTMGIDRTMNFFN